MSCITVSGLCFCIHHVLQKRIILSDLILQSLYKQRICVAATPGFIIVLRNQEIRTEEATIQQVDLYSLRDDLKNRISEIRNTVFSKNNLNELNFCIEELKQQRQLYPIFKNMTFSEIDNITSAKSRNVYKLKAEYLKLISTIRDLELTLKILMPEEAIPQSWEMDNTATHVDKIMQHSNVTDVVGQEDTSLGSISRPIVGYDELNDNNVFNRPVMVYSSSATSWILDEVPVWDLVTRNPMVRSRLRNWSYFRGNLHLKITVTGTPFHIGRLFFAYYPYPAKNETLQYYKTFITINPDYRRPFLTYMSQNKHFAKSNVGENKPITMDIPFVSYKTKSRLFNSNALALSDSTPYDDMLDMGALYIMSKEAIETAAPTLDNITVRVYAWLSDVELSLPTGTQIAVAQSKECESGPIEDVATNVAVVADAVKKVPVLSSIAVPIANVSKKIAKIASMFGWSKPILDQKLMVRSLYPFDNAAHVIGSSTAKSITWDPQQSLNVDKPFLSVTDDELLIQNITKIPSYVSTVTWDTDSPVNTVLQEFLVTPWTCHKMLADTLYQPTAMMFGTMGFEYWRGSITYVMDVVCSKYHRGKIMIRYETNNHQHALLTTNSDLNKNYIQIIDIQETTHFEFTVPYVREYMWSTTPELVHVSRGEDSAIIPHAYQSSNGYFSVSVYSELTAPNASNAYIYIYAYSNDMRVQGPNGKRVPGNRDFALPESKEDKTIFAEPVTCMDFIKYSDTTNDAKASQMHFGEEIHSFRSYLKRYQSTSYLAVTNSATGRKVLTVVFPVMPVNKVQYQQTTPVFTNTNPSIFDHLSYAFVGYSGSIRKRVYFTSDTGAVDDYCRVSITPSYTADPYIPVASVSAGPIPSDCRGTINFMPTVNSGIEFEIPFYNSNLFKFTQDGYISSHAGMVQKGIDTYQIHFGYRGQMGNAGVLEESIAGEDFNFHYFVGAPFFTSM